MNKIINWITATKLRRWMLFFPIAFICMLLANIFLEIINRLTIEGRIFSSDGILFNFYNMTTAGLVSGYVLIYVGGYIAPSKKGITILKALLIISAIMVITGNLFLFDDKDYWICLYVIFTLIGVFLAQNVLEDKNNINN